MFDTLFFHLLLNGLAHGMLIFLIASGLSLIFGLMRVVNFTHGSFFMFGAYVGRSIYLATDSFVLAILGGLLFGFVCGGLVERIAIRPFFGNRVQLLLLTLGMMLVMNELVKIIWGPTILRFPRPDYLIGSFMLGDIILPYYRMFIVGFGLVVLVIVYLFLNKTRLGIKIRAGVENPEMVQSFGINIKQVFTFTFALGVSLASVGGVISGPFLSVYPEIAMDNILVAIIAVVVGGIGSFGGSVAGSLLIGLINSFGGFYLPQAAMAFNVVLMALVLLVRPQGLFGRGGVAGGR